jgi:putative Ca2+/H+ antiporter (TMEM165/GDT1 family)
LDFKLFATVFVTVLLAEFGDKTQLGTLLYATDSAHSRVVVFLAATSALALSAAIAVPGGGALGALVGARAIRIIAAIGFIAVGVWMLWPALRAAS